MAGNANKEYLIVTISVGGWDFHGTARGMAEARERCTALADQGLDAMAVTWNAHLIINGAGRRIAEAAKARKVAEAEAERLSAAADQAKRDEGSVYHRRQVDWDRELGGATDEDPGLWIDL